MKKLMLILGLVIVLGTITAQAAPQSYGIMLGVGYDNNSLTQVADLPFKMINPAKPALNLIFEIINDKIITGFTITNNSGILVNFGFRF